MILFRKKSNYIFCKFSREKKKNFESTQGSGIGEVWKLNLHLNSEGYKGESLMILLRRIINTKIYYLSIFHKNCISVVAVYITHHWECQLGKWNELSIPPI